MATRTYISTAERRTPRPRSKRLRECGGGSYVSVGSVTYGGGSSSSADVSGLREELDSLRTEFEGCCAEMEGRVSGIEAEIADLRKLFDPLRGALGIVRLAIVVTDPSGATVTIGGEERDSVYVASGTEVEWRVEADGYITRTGTLAVTEDTELEIALTALSAAIVSFSYGDIPAAGGTALPTVVLAEGAEGAELSYEGESADPETGAVSADSLGTEDRDRSMVAAVTLRARFDGGAASAAATVWQEANVVVSTTTERTNERLMIDGFEYPDVPAEGGIVYPEVGFVYDYEDVDIYTYTSGEQKREGRGSAYQSLPDDADGLNTEYSFKRGMVIAILPDGGVFVWEEAATSLERTLLVTVTCDASYTSPTGAELTASADADVYQEPREAWLRVDPDSLTFGAEGGSADVAVDSSTGDFAIEGTSDSWLFARNGRAPGGSAATTITVTAEANEGGFIRSGSVTISNGDGCEAEVAVAQAADKSPTVIMRTLTVDIKTTGASLQEGWMTASPTLKLTCGGVTETAGITGIVGATEWTWSGEYEDGSVVSYEVSMDGYTTVTGSVTMDADRTVSVALRAASGGGGLLG